MWRRRLHLCLAFAFLCASVVNGAAQKIWTGAVNNAWSNAGNWNGGVPASTDIAIFPVSASNESMTNDLNVTLTAIDFQGGDYTIGGNDVSVLSSITSASGLGSTPNRFNAKVKALGTQPFTSTSGLLVFNGGIELSTGVNLLRSSRSSIQFS